MQPAVAFLQHRFRQWRSLALLEYALYGLALALPVSALLHQQLAWALPALLLMGSVLTCGTMLLLAWRRGWFRATPADLAHYLNRHYPALENSADLLLVSPDRLPRLAQLQRQRVAGRLAGLDIRLPHQLPRATAAVLLSLFISWGSLQLPSSAGEKPDLFQTEAAAEQTAPTKFSGGAMPPELQEVTVRILPPAYTRRQGRTSDALDIEAPVGSTVRWSLHFAPAIAEGRLTTGDGRERPLRPAGDGARSVALQLDRTTFYTLHYRSAGGAWISSDYYRLEALPDRPPQIAVDGLPPYIEYPYSEQRTLRFSAAFSDDYGISDARMIATVSRGEGESVQFRDDTLRFDASFSRSAKHYELSKTLRLAELGMGPGDELYLHLEALDNRSPQPQITKTSKFIIAFEDPEAVAMDMAGGLAVNRLPAYFRSQRQIIIDTEKLIAREDALDASAFQEESNQIAIDQKLLRLRYGRFLGEEFQTVIGELPAAEAGGDQDEHEHDGHEHEEQAHEEPAAEGEGAAHEHEHAHESSSSEDIAVAELEPYYHTHDITEEVTFFDAATTAKLRAALAQMWDAELHLRLGRPRQALPFEYRALRLIKEIQQASRIYVERVGFEPPVINVAEKRLTGALDDINSPRRQHDTPDAPPYPAIARAAPILETLRRAGRAPDAREYQHLQAAGEELATLALEQPGVYLISLQQLRTVMENGGAPAQRRQHLRELQRVFWSLLPDQQVVPHKAEMRAGNLKELYLEELLRESR